MQIIVLGMHRSGTSVVTRLVNLMGASIGDEGTALGFSDRQNPKGFWERKDVIELDQALLRSAGASWDRISAFQLDSVPRDAREEFEGGAREVIRNLDTRRPWVLKEPRLCLLLPFWRPLLEIPVIVSVQRQPLAVARSLQRRNGISISVGIALWERYVLAASDASRELPVVQVSFDALMQDPLVETKQLWRRLVDVGVNGLRCPSAREVEAFVESRHYHYEAVSDEELARAMYPGQLDLYKALREGQDPDRIERFELSGISRSLLHMYDDSESCRIAIEDESQRLGGLRSQIQPVQSDSAQARAKFLQLQERLQTIQAQTAGQNEPKAQTWSSPYLKQRFECRPVSADIIVCVHNALEDVRRCLESVVLQTWVTIRLILVNDGSDEATSSYLREFADARQYATLLESSEASGYTRAANRGLEEAGGDIVVLLNSDTVVTGGWLQRLFECFDSSPKIGIVGPLSNAATYQSVPRRFGADGDWQINQLPVGWDCERMAGVVDAVSKRRFPRVPFVNGFCYAIRREVLSAIGRFDEESFPRGYGEENDYSLRAAEAGFELAITDHAYVFHAMSKSYSHETRRELSATAREAFHAKHDRDEIRRKVELLDQQPELASCRREIASALSLVHFEISGESQTLRVLFVLPVSGGGGGVHSIVQEVCGMRRLGCDARVAVPTQHLRRFQESYPMLDPSIFCGADDKDLPTVAQGAHVVVGTIFTSIRRIAPICAENPDIVPMYYIQDYEPWIVDRGSDYEKEALASYELIPGMVCFAKTRWLCDTVSRYHDIEIHKVKPSLDRMIYHLPEGKPADDAIRVAAMVRPSTPYRSPGVTMEILAAVSRELGPRIKPLIFGCDSEDPEFLKLERSFEFENAGVLRRDEVAELLRGSHIFVDFSTYQAFGRTGLEAMASGCAVILPQKGGTDEYAKDRHNALVVDTSSFSAMHDALLELIRDRALRRSLAQEGLRTAEGYSVHSAAISELELFKQLVLRKRQASLAEPRSSSLEKG